jgi:TRAP-type C4-dicarboxylate transport system permease small subunit
MSQTTLTSAATLNEVMAPVRWVDYVIDAASVVIAVTTITVMFFSLMAEVVVRYVTNQGMGWPTEMPNLLFPWLVMSGIVLAAQRGKHIAVTTIQGFLSRGANRVLLVLLQALVAVTFFYLAWVSLLVIDITGSEVYPVTRVSAKWAYMAMTVGFVVLGITAVTTIIRVLQASNPLAVRAHAIEESE